MLLRRQKRRQCCQSTPEGSLSPDSAWGRASSPRLPRSAQQLLQGQGCVPAGAHATGFALTARQVRGLPGASASASPSTARGCPAPTWSPRPQECMTVSLQRTALLLQGPYRTLGPRGTPVSQSTTQLSYKPKLGTMSSLFFNPPIHRICTQSLAPESKPHRQAPVQSLPHAAVPCCTHLVAGEPEAPPAQGLTGAERGTAVRVINTSQILKQHKPHY